MKNASATEEQWVAWFDLQQAATQTWFSGALPRAIKMLDEFLLTRPSLPIERQAIGFRGSLHEESGDLQLAREDFRAAVELCERPDFERYTLEESLAALSERLEDYIEAERWSLRALKTAAADPKTSGAGSLLQLLRLRSGQQLSRKERQIVKKVVHQAWSLLRVEGDPDFADLAATAGKLLNAQQGPFSGDHPPMPKLHQEDADEE